jgi:glutaminyl-tRNA synthetase
MAVLDPIKLIITNYEKGEEMLEIENNAEADGPAVRLTPFSGELYIERGDFSENPPKKYTRLFIGNEVRLKGAYFVKCTGVVKDSSGNIVEVHCTYDPETKSGSGFTGRKVKSTIHWASVKHAVKASVRLYDYLVIDDDSEELGFRKNPTTLTVMGNCYMEPAINSAKLEDRFQFIRNGYFCLDSKYSSSSNLVFNCIVGLKSSYKA